jgi:HD superfamily phosphohydrolase
LNKKKIINDPLYGFITIPNELIYDIINHRYFQRLRRIKQLGMTDFVYPGALHTRFHHALGSMHLMNEALNNLIKKGIEISDEEFEAADRHSAARCWPCAIFPCPGKRAGLGLTMSGFLPLSWNNSIVNLAGA